MNRNQRRLAKKQERRSPQENAAQSIQDTFAIALRHQQTGNLVEAERLYRHILALDPQHTDSLHLLGVMASQAGQQEIAINLIGQAIRLNDQIPHYHNNIGKIFIDLGRLDEAAEHIRRAITLKPDYANAHNNLGLVYFARKDHEAAMQQFNKAVAAEPNHADALNNLAAFALYSGHLGDSLAYYERLHALRPQNSEFYLQTKVVQFFMAPMKEWGALCQEALGWPSLSDEHRFGILIHSAISCWAMGDWKNLVETLRAAQDSPWATQKSSHKGIYGSQVYRNFLLALVAYYVNAPYQPPSYKDTIAIVGDSHCLSYANTAVDSGGITKGITPHLITGCKAWHISRDSLNQYKWSFHTILERLPVGSACIMSFGEIDCRYDEGIIVHYKKHGGVLDDIIASTVQNYARAVHKAAQKRQLKASFLNVPAPNSDALRQKNTALTQEDESLLAHIVRQFNECLAKEAAALNFPVIDVYRLTVGPDGKSNGQHHIDGHHLKPYVLALAMNGAFR